jgi:hypothetical protein
MWETEAMPVLSCLTIMAGTVRHALIDKSIYQIRIRHDGTHGMQPLQQRMPLQLDRAHFALASG